MRWILTLLLTSVIGIFVLMACEGNVFSLKEGDCFNGALANTEHSIEVRNVDLVSCDEPHESEVYAVFELPDSIWKGEDYVFEQGGKGCQARFEAFVGIEYELSTLYVDVYYPLEASWKEMDDRAVTCVLVDDMNVSRSGSLKGSRR